jgi:hypothetical protein
LDGLFSVMDCGVGTFYPFNDDNVPSGRRNSRKAHPKGFMEKFVRTIGLTSVNFGLVFIVNQSGAIYPITHIRGQIGDLKKERDPVGLLSCVLSIHILVIVADPITVCLLFVQLKSKVYLKSDKLPHHKTLLSMYASCYSCCRVVVYVSTRAPRSDALQVINTTTARKYASHQAHKSVLSGIINGTRYDSKLACTCYHTWSLGIVTC